MKSCDTLNVNSSNAPLPSTALTVTVAIPYPFATNLTPFSVFSIAITSSLELFHSISLLVALSGVTVAVNSISSSLFI